ncbi:MAG: VIT1/CCC1 transporter family protein [Burkholderiaceae bacterium]
MGSAPAAHCLATARVLPPPIAHPPGSPCHPLHAAFRSRRHRTDRIGWLRAAVLGANDGIVSTASLVVGVAAAQASPSTILMTAVAGLVAGAMSMAAGEYVSVHSQADYRKGRHRARTP